MASSLNDQLALFTQYDNEYCNKATDVSRKIQAVASLSGGAFSCCSDCLVRLWSRNCRLCMLLKYLRSTGQKCDVQR